jgi:hypothetical protein
MGAEFNACSALVVQGFAHDVISGKSASDNIEEVNQSGSLCVFSMPLNFSPAAGCSAMQCLCHSLKLLPSWTEIIRLSSSWVQRLRYQVLSCSKDTIGCQQWQRTLCLLGVVTDLGVFFSGRIFRAYVGKVLKWNEAGSCMSQHRATCADVLTEPLPHNRLEERRSTLRHHT